MTRVLVVDDEPQIRRALAINLSARGYDVDMAASGEEALRQAATANPDAVLLDLGLPGIDGTEVVRTLRGWSNVPIIILSVRDTEHDKVAALDAGADDYVTKPFGIDELLARLRSALRRHLVPADATLVQTDAFTIDLVASTAWRDGAEVHLTPTEWQLVSQLVRNPGRLVSQKSMLQQIWGPDHPKDTTLLRVHLAGLRRKLEPNPSQPRYFVTEPGMGYRFEPQQESRP
jgi:two-component system, OmpR family, KDP operon response regulator KdpE